MDAALDLFVNAMKWRKEENIDNLVETFQDDFWFDFLSSYWPTSISPERTFFTKDGCPIIYERIGLVSPKLVNYIPLQTLFLWHVYTVELIERENEKVVANIGFSPGNILCEDLDALAASHVTKMSNLIKTISASDEARYPESVRKIYIVNPPGVFSLAMAVVKPWLDERTLQKFSNGSPSAFTEEWKIVVGEDNLPKYLGGTLEWAPPAGGNVKKHLEAKGIKIDKVAIPRRGDHSIDVTAKKDQTIYFQVMLKRSDINASILIKRGDKKEPVLTAKKVDSDASPVLLSVVAPEDGEYILYLDNTDSPMMGRNLKTLFWVKDPFVPKEVEVKEEKKKKKSTKSKGSSTKSPRDKKEKKEKKATDGV